jgi:hypothetical protein
MAVPVPLLVVILVGLILWSLPLRTESRLGVPPMVKDIGRIMFACALLALMLAAAGHSVRLL